MLSSVSLRLLANILNILELCLIGWDQTSWNINQRNVTSSKLSFIALIIFDVGFSFCCLLKQWNSFSLEQNSGCICRQAFIHYCGLNQVWGRTEKLCFIWAVRHSFSVLPQTWWSPQKWMKACLQMQPEFCSREKLLYFLDHLVSRKNVYIYYLRSYKALKNLLSKDT